MKTDAEEHYLARMQDFAKGYGIGNPFLYEGKGESPSASFSISESILAIPSRVFGISVPALNLIYKFLLPAIIFLLLYGLNYRLTQDKFWSIATSISIILGYVIFTTQGIKDLIGMKWTDFPANMYSRPVNPELSSILFLSYLHILLSAFRENSKKILIYLYLIFALSFYIYFYSFTFFLALNAVTFAIFFLVNRKREAVSIFSISILGLITGCLTFINLYSLTHHSDYVYLAPISNIVKSHFPVFSSLGILTIFVIGFYFYKRRHNLEKDDYFALSLLATAFIAINQQVITGVSIQEGHYHWYFNTPIYILILFYIAHKYKDYISINTKFLICSVFILLSFFTSFLGQYNYYKYWQPLTTSNQRYAGALVWLDKNASREDVVLSNNESSLLVPIYTKSNVSWNYFTLAYLTPRERTIYNLFIYLKINNVKPSDIFEEDYFHPPVVNKPETRNNPGLQFVEVNILLRDYMTGIYPNNMLSMYKDFYNKSWSEIFKMYKLDYVLWDKKTDPKWKFDQDNLKIVFESDNVAIYKIN